MCIRDRYQRRVRGKPRQTDMHALAHAPILGLSVAVLWIAVPVRAFGFAGTTEHISGTFDAALQSEVPEVCASLPAGFFAPVKASCSLPAGLVVAGLFNKLADSFNNTGLQGPNVSSLAVLPTGHSRWLAVAPVNGTVSQLLCLGPDLLVLAGKFWQLGNHKVHNLAVLRAPTLLDGHWEMLAAPAISSANTSGPDNAAAVLALHQLVLPSGPLCQLFIGGLFERFEGVLVNNLVRVSLHTSTGQFVPNSAVPASPVLLPPLPGHAMLGTDGLVTSIQALDQSTVAVGGIFTRVGGAPCIGLCVWDVAKQQAAPVLRLLAGTVYTMKLLRRNEVAVGLLVAGSQLQLSYWTAYSVVLLPLPLLASTQGAIPLGYSPEAIVYSVDTQPVLTTTGGAWKVLLGGNDPAAPVLLLPSAMLTASSTSGWANGSALHPVGSEESSAIAAQGTHVRFIGSSVLLGGWFSQPAVNFAMAPLLPNNTLGALLPGSTPQGADWLCPPGFYCASAGLVGPACPARSYCGAPGRARWSISVCPGGFYCPDTAHILVCPSGSYCRAGSVSPRGCPPFVPCPEGTEVPIDGFLGIAISMIILGGTGFAAQGIAWYKWGGAPGWMLALLTGLYRCTGSSDYQPVPPDRGESSTEASGLTEQLNARVNSAGLSLRRSLSFGANEGPLKLSRVDSIKFDEELDVGRDRSPRALTGLYISSVELGSLQEHISKVDIEFEALGLQLTKKPNKVVLEQVSGMFLHGQVGAILGPSGSGKTTLLNALSGKARGYAQVTGSMFVNGTEQPNVGRTCQGLFGFVPQDDIMHRTLSVQENLIYSHQLRVRTDCSWFRGATCAAVVDDIVCMLGLQSIRHEVVGDADNKGISGGQRRRLAIGQELAANPSVLFLDEPTSGLDSTSSLSVFMVLQRLARLGMNIVLVIHQPRCTLHSS
eukprot:TRINITY_DN801_c0_g1_i1.p1 TRINITY_DN801_c0_g1~~TRINITY_DN801_c0_g1_i1.p1  ORF type:complete len:933 (-),score=272.67 TRINITY_DN801_c0_g1_i1:656-3454(-)